MRTPTSLLRTGPLTLLAPLALLLLSACGQGDVEIDPDAVARYGAFRYERGAATSATSGTGGGGATTVAVSKTPGGVPVAAPAASDPPVAPAGGAPAGGAPAGGAPAGGAPVGSGKARAKAGKYEVIAVADGGTIKITCKVTKMLEPFVFPLNKNQEGCGHTTLPSERAVIDPTTLGLKNCVVSLVEISKGKDFEGEMAKSDRLVILDQKSCRYVPHVALVRAGTKISVKNSDPVEHNAKAFFNNKAALQFNVMSSSGSLQEPNDDTTLKKPGNYLLSCDIHFWMTGFIRVVSHPYWAVTAEDGTATLTNVPPGTYKVACWHEGMVMGLVQNGAEVSDYKFSNDFELPPQDVTVTAGATSEVAFTIEPR